MSIKQSLYAFDRRARELDDYVGCDLDAPAIDMVALAASMGVAARRITRPTELKAALEEGLATTVPLLLDVAVDARDYFPRNG